MYCAKCGLEINDDSIFCQHCEEACSQSVSANTGSDERSKLLSRIYTFREKTKCLDKSFLQLQQISQERIRRENTAGKSFFLVISVLAPMLLFLLFLDTYLKQVSMSALKTNPVYMVIMYVVLASPFIAYLIYRFHNLRRRKALRVEREELSALIYSHYQAIDDKTIPYDYIDKNSTECIVRYVRDGYANTVQEAIIRMNEDMHNKTIELIAAKSLNELKIANQPKPARMAGKAALKLFSAIYKNI